MKTSTPIGRRATLATLVWQLETHLRDLQRLEADVDADVARGLGIVLDQQALENLVEAVGCVEEAVDDLKGNPPEGGTS